MSQLSLFDDPDEPRRPSDPVAERLAESKADAQRIAAALPAGVRFGTSSWSFPGWRGIVFGHGDASPTALAREGLREYARHPLLRTVGVDRSFYAPVPVEDLARYHDQLPASFPCCFKAPASIASPVTPFTRGRPTANAQFLSAERFAADLLEPVARVFREHAGPFVVEISPTPRGFTLEPSTFCEQLDRMLGHLPGEFQFAVELRDLALMTGEYARVLRRHGAAHVYNYWSAMPMPGLQSESLGLDDMPFAMVRLLLRPGAWYEDQREAFRPFDRIVQPDFEMRAQVADIVADAVGRRIPAYVLVNNKAEGSAPLTVRELARMVVEKMAL